MIDPEVLKARLLDLDGRLSAVEQIAAAALAATFADEDAMRRFTADADDEIQRLIVARETAGISAPTAYEHAWAAILARVRLQFARKG